MWWWCCKRRRRAVAFHVFIGPIVSKQGGISMPHETNAITTAQKVLVTAVPVDDSDQEVLDAEPVGFTIASGTCTIEPVGPTSAFVVSGSVAEVCTVNLAGRTGVPMDVVTVPVTAPSAATRFRITSDAPVPK